jgi:hypothetical protein
MKLSEKNVLIATGILFIIVIATLNFGNQEIADQLEKQPRLEVASSSYNANDGKLILEFEKPAKEFEFSRITIFDGNNKSYSGESKRKSEYIIINTYIPELTSGDVLNIVIEEAISTKELKIAYKIPESIIVPI